MIVRQFTSSGKLKRRMRRQRNAFAALQQREIGVFARSSLRLRTDYLWTSLRTRSVSFEEGALFVKLTTNNKVLQLGERT